MKKSLMIVALIVFLSFTTGCEKEKILDCTMSQDSTGIKMGQNIKATFKKNEVKNMEIVINVELEEKYKNYKTTMITRVENQFSSYKNKEGITFNTKENDLGFVVTIKANLEKMSDSLKEELDMIDTTGDYEKTKDQLIESGYTCK